MTPLQQHQEEIEKNLGFWQRKPLLQEIYNGFYRRILVSVDTRLPGAIVEIGSGIGNLKQHLPGAICTDLFPNPWLDLVCDAYELPFASATVSHLILFDVFHHLQRPAAFLAEARRVLCDGGRVVLFEPYISIASYPVYGLLHHEPVALRAEIDRSETPPAPRDYYAAQGNATRLFFGQLSPQTFHDFRVTRAEAFSSFAYLFSGGYSKPAVYPRAMLPMWGMIDSVLSHFPRLFAGRCLVELRATSTSV